GCTLLVLALGNGLFGYSLLDDQLSGTGLRIVYSIALSIPLVGTWITSLLFGGEFPGPDIIKRLYVLHLLLIPALITGRRAALRAAHPAPPGARGGAARGPPWPRRPAQAHAGPGAGPPGGQRRRRAAVADLRRQGDRAVLPHLGGARRPRRGVPDQPHLDLR